MQKFKFAGIAIAFILACGPLLGLSNQVVARVKIRIEADPRGLRNGQIRPAPSVKEFSSALNQLNFDVATIVGIKAESTTLQDARKAPRKGPGQ
ncbi:MAG TPA: hypothetical protein VMT22_05320 [Terriglobales bacterium]|nr:hypothetical protein [Terriglobales bacterium]